MSLTRLLFLDLLVMILNFVMLGLIIERVKVTDSRDAIATNSTATGRGAQDGSAQAQDHDHEERGILSHEAQPGTSPNRSETDLREQVSHATPPNTDSHLQPPSEEELERTRLLADPADIGRHTNDQHALDAYSSGEAVIVRMGLINVIREQWQYRPSAARRSASYAPSDQTAAFLRERFGLRINDEGRLERITT